MAPSARNASPDDAVMENETDTEVQPPAGQVESLVEDVEMDPGFEIAVADEGRHCLACAWSPFCRSASRSDGACINRFDTSNGLTFETSFGQYVGNLFACGDVFH